MTEVVCGVILDARGRVLACKRAKDRHLGGLWEFPGGKLEPGEQPSAALARELSEELAIETEAVQSLTPVEWHYGEISILLMPWICRILVGQPVALEHEEIQWVDPHDCEQLPWAAADLPILRELQTRMR